MARGSFIAHVRNNFLAGITALLPLWAVYFVVKFIVSFVNDALLDPIMGFIKPYDVGIDPRVVVFGVKILIFVSIIVLIVFLGMIIKNLLVRRILSLGENILLRVPLINKVYAAMQQIARTFLMQKRAIFSRAVLVEYPRKGVYVLGLVTSEARGEVQDKTKGDLIAVFIPTTPNPTSGFLLFVPKQELITLTMTVEDSMKMIVSGGAVVPEYRSMK